MDEAQALPCEALGPSLRIENVVDEHYDDLYRFLRHLTRHRETAEDLTQQTFLTAHLRLRSFRGDASLRTWLHTLAFREYTGWRRRRRLVAPLLDRFAARDPGHKAIEDGEWLLAALHRLKPAMRDAFLMHEVQELTIEEIATVLGAPEGTVKARLHHARAALRRSLEPGDHA